MVNARTRVRRIFGVMILLFALLFALGGFFSYRHAKEESVYLVYTAVFEVDARLADCVRVGDHLTDACGKEDAGEILKITAEDALREDAFGVFKAPERVTLALTLGGSGIKAKGEVKIGTLTPRVGETVYLFGKARLTGLCVGVKAI